MRYPIFLIILFANILLTYGSSAPKYPVSQIPQGLKEKMYGVIRERDVEVRVLGKNRSAVYRREVITILNKNGADLAEKIVSYDKYSKINFIKANLYDAQGVLIRKIKASEIYDRSAYDGFSLYSDNRIKYLDLTHNVYPYTLEFEYEKEYKYLYSFPDFRLYSDDEVSIQQSTFTVSYPLGLEPRYKALNTEEPKKVTEGAISKLIWTFQNVKPNKWEQYSPDPEKIVPTILVSPDEFDFAGYPGKMDTWENYGKWNWSLNEGRDVLPESTVQLVKKLTEGKSDYEKIKILYEYLQNKTRYVSIQVGIGGLQPFEAKVVDQVGYGDCKALSNYMVALLKQVGIKGYYTTIMAGEGESEVITDFPSDQSNHIIVAVPHENDTIWLECTSQTSPFGFLGRFTGNRYGMLVSEKGGFLVKTPSFHADTDVVERFAQVKLSPSGSSSAKISTKYKGARYDDFNHIGQYTKLPGDEQKKWIERTTRISSFDIKSFSMKTVVDERTPVAQVELNLSLPNLASVSGKRIFLTPNLMNRHTYIPEKVQSRQTNVVIRMPYTDIDTIEYEIPEDVYPEFLPEPILIKSRFGEYEARCTVEQGRIRYVRQIRVEQVEYPPDSYNELIEFYKAINRADNMKLVFLTKT